MAKQQQAPAKTGDPTKMVTSTHRVAFVHLDAPYAFKDDDGTEATPKYSVTLIIPEAHPDVAKIVAIMKLLHASEAQTKFKGLAYTASKVWKPLRDGDEYADEQLAKGRPEEQLSMFRGCYWIKVTSLSPVVCFDEQGGEVLDIRDQFYSGMYMRCEIKGSAFNQKGNAGFSFWINSARKTKDGPRIGGYVADVGVYDEDVDNTDVDSLSEYEETAAPLPVTNKGGRQFAKDAGGAQIYSDDGGNSWFYI